jgi:hypothetical protein
MCDVVRSTEAVRDEINGRDWLEACLCAVICTKPSVHLQCILALYALGFCLFWDVFTRLWSNPEHFLIFLRNIF